jgi:hypothetical protein
MTFMAKRRSGGAISSVSVDRLQAGQLAASTPLSVRMPKLR